MTAILEGAPRRTERRWIVAPRSESAASINWSDICGFPCIAELLRRKRLADKDALDAFLWPRLQSLADPYLLPNVGAAVDRILSAVDRRERIVLFGDYDVDGVTSVALLAELFTAYGLTPALFLPLRMEEGYGLSAESIARCRAEHTPQLLIAVDCGTSSAAEIAELRRHGIDVIVLDHHEPKADLPECVAVVNPKITSRGAFNYLCTAGLAFKLAHALLKARPIADFDLRRELDLVALGTVADIVPLTEENRLLVKRGLLELARTSRVGLRKLMEIADVGPIPASEHIAFRLGPRLNAAGRLATAEKALRLLTTTNAAEATVLASELDAQNRERQTVEKSILSEAEEELARSFMPDQQAAIVLGARGWHPGVLGIVASRLSKKYCRPTIIVGFDGNGLGKGSGRSIEGLSIVQALGDCDALLEKFGGHEMAAGVSVREENFAAFVEAFRRAARARLTDEQLQPCLSVDHEVRFAELSPDFLEWHEMLEPFGNANPQPVFFARAVEPAATPQVVKEKHVALRLRQGNHHRRAIYFDAATIELPRAPWDVAFQVSSDFYEGERRLQMQVQAIREATA